MLSTIFPHLPVRHHRQLIWNVSIAQLYFDTNRSIPWQLTIEKRLSMEKMPTATTIIDECRPLKRLNSISIVMIPFVEFPNHASKISRFSLSVSHLASQHIHLYHCFRPNPAIIKLDQLIVSRFFSLSRTLFFLYPPIPLYLQFIHTCMKNLFIVHPIGLCSIAHDHIRLY